MMQVEKSHIPYPDEPPVHFPPSKVWRDLLETRKRYATSDFEGDMPPRTRKRMEFLKSALDNPIAEIEKGEVSLSILLELLQDFASPVGAARDPSRKVNIILNADAFTRETGMQFDADRRIKISTKLVGVSLSTVLRIICDQIDGTYWVRRDYIEIVPRGMAITEKVTRVFPVGDLIIGIPNAINQSALSQSISVLGQTFSLGGGPGGAPVVFNGNAGGIGIVQFGGGIGGAGIGGGAGGQQFGGFGAGAAGGLFNGGCNGGIRGFGGGIQGQFGNLGGQFGFQGQDYGPVLTQLITEVVAKGEWSTPQNLFCAGGGGGAAGNVDPALDPQVGGLTADQLNSLGYWPPARALIVRGTSRIHRTTSSKLTPKGAMGGAMGFIPRGGDPNVVGQIGGDVVKADPKKDPKASSKTDPKAIAAELEQRHSEIVRKIVDKEKDLDPEKIYQMLLDKGVTEPGEIIACADFMVGCKQFKHAAELLKASLRSGVVAEPWAQEALAIALEGSQGSPEEIERARVSAIDLAPKSSLAYVKAAKAMADMGQLDRAAKFCRDAARLEPNSPDAYVNALAFAGDKKATLDADLSAWAAGNLLARDWTTDTAEYHLRARAHLNAQIAKFAAEHKPAEEKTVQAVLDNEKRRDLVIELLWSGPADLDLKVREPIGTVCSSLERQTSGGGILLGDDFTQKDDSRSETYKASEAFNGSYEVSVDRVWGRPLGNRALLKVTRHQGMPEQTVEIYPIDLTKRASQAVTFEGGRRTSLATVPPVGATPDVARKPERAQETVNKLRAMINGGSAAMAGGTGSATQKAGAAHDNFDSPLVELSHQTSIASAAPGGMEIRQQTTMSRDGKKVQVKMAPVFDTVTAKQAKLKLDFIPGAE
jgi:tetratricopeptide (TPR) repeat protein